MRRRWVLVGFFLPPLVYAQNNFRGNVIRIMGKVSRESFDKQKVVKRLFKDEVFLNTNLIEELKMGDKIFEGDKIVTHEKSFVQLSLPEKSIFVLGPLSELVISDEEFLHKVGCMHSIIPHGNPDRIKVSTPQAAMGIRGTEFITQINGDVSHIALLDGELKVENKKESKILASKRLLNVTQDKMEQPLIISDANIFLLKKNSVFEDVNLDGLSNPAEQQKIEPEPILRKDSKKKSWMDLLNENQQIKRE